MNRSGYRFGIVFAIAMLMALGTRSQENYLEEMVQYRDSINQEFSDPEKTILDEKDLKHFDGVDFFEVDIKYHVEANFERIKGGKLVKMPTSTERIAQYREYGTLSFQIGEEAFQLTVYQNMTFTKGHEYEDYLFLPFTDESTGIESYGSGRYLDVRISKISDGKVMLDFNKCYAPNCAYSHKYSCPIPPSNNSLPIKILAGATGLMEH